MKDFSSQQGQHSWLFLLWESTSYILVNYWHTFSTVSIDPTRGNKSGISYNFINIEKLLEPRPLLVDGPDPWDQGGFNILYVLFLLSLTFLFVPRSLKNPFTEF